jgi:hypothetical protein
MKYLPIIGVLFLLNACVAEPDGTPGVEFKADSISLTLSSGELIRVTGIGFDTSVRLSSPEVGELTIDTLRPHELVFRSPWPRDSYDIILSKGMTLLRLGKITISRQVLSSVHLEDGKYTYVQDQWQLTGKPHAWHLNNDGTFSQSVLQSTLRVLDSTVSFEIRNGEVVVKPEEPMPGVILTFSGALDPTRSEFLTFSLAEKVTEWWTYPEKSGYYTSQGTQSARELRLEQSGGLIVATAFGHACGSASSHGESPDGIHSSSFRATGESSVRFYLRKVQ